MTARMPAGMQYEDFRAALAKAPGDFQLRLIYSDWLESEGFPELAWVQKEIAGMRYKPMPSNFAGERTPCWDWRSKEWDDSTPVECVLPAGIFDQVWSRSVTAVDYPDLTVFAEFRTQADAYEALEEALLEYIGYETPEKEQK